MQCNRPFTLSRFQYRQHNGERPATVGAVYDRLFLSPDHAAKMFKLQL